MNRSCANRRVFVDTETTGLDVERGDRIVEIGCVEMVDRQLTGRQLHFYVNPERPSDADALRVHGLTQEFLAGKPLFSHVASDVASFLAGAELIIHNASFDIAFLDEELRRAELPNVTSLASSVTDSLRLARELFPGRVNSLDALCRRFDVDTSARNLHGALLDASLLAKAYLAMTQEQHALELIQSGRACGHVDGNDSDLSSVELPVILPTPAELQAHEALMAVIAAEAKPARRPQP